MMLKPGQMYGMDVAFTFWEKHVMPRDTRMHWVMNMIQEFRHQTGVDPNRIIVRDDPDDLGVGVISFQYIPGGGELQVRKATKKVPPPSLSLARWMISEWVRRIQRSPRLVGLVPESTRGPRP